MAGVRVKSFFERPTAILKYPLEKTPELSSSISPSVSLTAAQTI